MPDLPHPEQSESYVPAQAEPRSGMLRGWDTSVIARLAGVLILYLAVAVAYWPSSVALNSIWRDTQKETYTHGYLVLLLSLWLIVRARKRLAATPVRPALTALAALAVLSALWVWAWRAAIQELHLLLVPLLLITAVAAALGWRAARVVAFPVGYLYFALPLWGNINGIVRSGSSWATGLLVWITGLPAYMQGNYVQLPSGTIEIANSCSGLHALIVGLALAALYGEIAHDPVQRRIKWLAVMGGLSLLVNWVRIFIVVGAAYFSDMRSSLVQHHYWLGWWLFAAAFAGFLWWAEHRAPSDSPPTPKPPGATDSRLPLGRVALVLTVLAALPAWAYSIDWARFANEHRPVTIAWPAAPEEWRGPLTVDSGEWAPHFLGASGESLRAYSDPKGRTIEAFAVAYRVQTQQGKLLGYHDTLLGAGKRLRVESAHIVSSPVGLWRETLAVDSQGRQSLIWSRYRIGNRLFVEPRLSQMWYGVEALVSPPLSSLIALRSPCAPDCAAAGVRLSAAAAILRPTLR